MARTHAADARHPWIDLATVRETIALMHDDLAQSPHLAAVRDALAVAMAEIDAVEKPGKKPSPRLPEQLAARFVPWVPEA